jgi:DNA-binding MarR family transcriptional regulator
MMQYTPNWDNIKTVKDLKGLLETLQIRADARIYNNCTEEGKKFWRELTNEELGSLVRQVKEALEKQQQAMQQQANVV